MEKIYYNGDIITMEDEGKYPEAIYVSDGIIKAIGSYDTLVSQKSEDCELIDLEGHTLMPSFIDGHGHLSMASVQYGKKIDLEDAKSFDDLVSMIKTFIKEHNIPAGEPINGYGYNTSVLKEQKHPNKEILDGASETHPIAICPATGHFGVANSLALERTGINATTKDPEGGFIERNPETNEPTGSLEEAAIYMAKGANEPVVDDPEGLLIEIQRLYASNGITTVQDGATSGEALDLMRKAGNEEKLYLDVVCYPTTMGVKTEDTIPHMMEKNKDIIEQYVNHVKIGGYKMIMDGSPQGKTAWMSQPYENSGDHCGYPWLSKEKVHESIKRALTDNQQIMAHCNGDAASQQFLDVYEEEYNASNNPNKSNLRPVMIHCQTVRDDQLKRMPQFNMIPSIFVSHIYYWGDIHLENLGSIRGARISPVKSALDCGLMYNFHTDTPVRLPLMLHSVWCAVNRLSSTGTSVGAEQCVDVYDALKGITINAAYAYYEEQSKGSIKEGKRADLVILDKNPLKVDKMEIKDINILETIKDGETIFKNERA